MATILNPSITITPSTPALGAPVDVEVSYTVRFTPMERLLANYGLIFRERIRLHDVDLPEGDANPNDFLRLLDGTNTIPSAVIAASPAAGLFISRTSNNPIPLSELQGPDDDGTPDLETIRARIRVFPVPSNALQVVGDMEFTQNSVLLDVDDGDFLPLP